MARNDEEVLMAAYTLLVRIEAEPDSRTPTDEELTRFTSRSSLETTWYSVHHYRRAVGTYVEVENTGTVCDFDATTEMLLDERGRPVADIAGLRLPPPRIEIPRTGRPLVLLAVGGGNQEFDHWDTEAGGSSSICGGQGGRCEVPEPAANNPYVLYAKAIFRKKPEDGRMGRFKGDQRPGRVGKIRLPPPGFAEPTQ